jgi:hypothetical protein
MKETYMRRIFNLICFLSVVAFAPALAHADDFNDTCQSHLKPTSISVEILPVTKASEVQFLPEKALTGQLRADDAGFTDGNITFGVTRATKKADFNYKMDFVEEKSTGRVCYSFKAVASVGYEPLTTYVASELKDASCMYKTVLQHEGEHVQIYKDFLPTIQPSLTDRLSKKIGTQPRFAKSKEDAYAQADDLLNKTILEEAGVELNGAVAANKELDRKEGRNIFDQCGSDGKTIATEIIMKKMALQQ